MKNREISANPKKMPLGERLGDKESCFCGVETEFNDDMPLLLSHNLSSTGFGFVVATLKSGTCLFKYPEEKKVERMKALCQASEHAIDCVDGKLVLLIKYDVTYPFAERKKYLFDELPTHRKFNVLGPERVLKMKRIDFGEYILIPILHGSIVEDVPSLEKFCSLVAKIAEDMDKKGTKKKKLKSPIVG